MEWTMEPRKRKLSPESYAKSEMQRLKLEALEEHGDFSFLVGPEKESAELMHCFKGDLLAASEYFRGLLRSPSSENPPVHMKHHQPHIFKMILKFVSVTALEQVSTLEDAVALGLAADEFLLDALKVFCVSEIKRLVTVETVWNTLNSIVLVPDLPEACSQVLSLETKKCLAHDSFLEASKESFIFLLDLDTLAINSELDLIDAAIKLACTKPVKEEVQLMKALIPHLRLLTLPMDQLDRLSKYLSKSQKYLLAERLMFKDESCAGNATPRLNLTTLPRSRPVQDVLNEQFLLEFIAEDLIKTNWDMIGVEQKGNRLRKRKVLQIELKPRQHLVLKGIEVLTRANNFPKLEFVSNTKEASTRVYPSKEEYIEDLGVYVTIFMKGECKRRVFTSLIESRKECNSWFYVDFGTKVFVPKGAVCKVEVHSDNFYQLIPFAHIKENIDKAAKCAAFSHFEFVFFEKSYKQYQLKPLEENVDYFFCIKSLSVVPVDEKGCLDTL